MQNDVATVGRIVRPQGNRGEVVVAPETDFGAERFRVGAVLRAMRDGEATLLTVRESREMAGRWVIGFDGITTIDGAEALRGMELVVAVDELPALEAGRYYLHDLVGCVVETTAGERVGEVMRVDREGTTVLVVQTARGEAMVPFAEPICRRIDVDAKTIVVDPPEGLLDL